MAGDETDGAAAGAGKASRKRRSDEKSSGGSGSGGKRAAKDKLDSARHEVAEASSPVDEASGVGVPPEPEVATASIVEALLFATDSPLPAARIAQLVGTGDVRSVRKHIESLNARYEAGGHAFRIEEIAKGFQLLTLPAYNNWLSKLLRARAETKLSPAALETLAIVAYKQPALRADIEAIRGVAAGEVLNRLREMNLVKIVGRAEELGRPMLYGTTKKFLEVFGLASLDDLPKVEALSSGADAGSSGGSTPEKTSAGSNSDSPPDGAESAVGDATGGQSADDVE